MPESPAQRAARERNLSKGNPRAYKGGGSQGEPPDPPGKAQDNPRPAPSQEAPPQSAPGDGYVRAKRSAKGAPKKPKESRSRPATPASAAPPPAPVSSGDGGGFFDGLREAFGR